MHQIKVRYIRLLSFPAWILLISELHGQNFAIKRGRQIRLISIHSRNILAYDYGIGPEPS